MVIHANRRLRTLAVGVALAAWSTSAAAAPLYGRVVVELKGFLGRYERRTHEIEVRVAGLATRTDADGFFAFEDVGAHGIHVPVGTPVVLGEDPDRNWIAFSLARRRIRLPVEWEAEAVDDVILLYPVTCELLADETGACTVESPDSEGRWRNPYVEHFRLSLPVVAAPVEKRTPPAAVPPVAAPIEPRPPVPAEPAAPVAPAEPVLPNPPIYESVHPGGVAPVDPIEPAGPVETETGDSEPEEPPLVEPLD